MLLKEQKYISLVMHVHVNIFTSPYDQCIKPLQSFKGLRTAKIYYN